MSANKIFIHSTLEVSYKRLKIKYMNYKNIIVTLRDILLYFVFDCYVQRVS